MTNPPTTALLRRPSCALRPLAVALGVAVLASVAPAGGPAPAAAAPAAGAQEETDKRAVDSSIQSLRDDLVGTSTELTSAYDTYARVESQLPAARAAVATAQTARSQAQAAADDLAARLAASLGAQAAAEQAVVEVGQQMQESQSSLGQMAASAYRGSGVPEGLALAMGAGSPEEFASRSAAISSLSAAEADAIAGMRSDAAVRESATTRLSAVREQVADLQRQGEEQLVVARAAEADAAAKQADVEALLAEQRQAVAAIEARRGEEEARLSQLQAESDALGAELARIAEQERARAAAEAERRAAEEAEREAQAQAQQRAQQRSEGSATTQRSAAPPPAVSRSSRASSGGALAMPSEGRLSSPFGNRFHPIRRVMRLHSGQDLAAGCGTPIVAAESGTVVSTSYNGSYGNIAVINHGMVGGEPLATAYAHMQGFAVSGGQSVSRGQVIGYEGTTGGSTGCHLHFEVRIAGEAVDPLGYL